LNSLVGGSSQQNHLLTSGSRCPHRFSHRFIVITCAVGLPRELRLAGMGLLQVDIGGLGSLAARCRSLAGEVSAVTTAPSPAAPSGQATASAVQAVAASVTAAGEAMTTRLAATSTKLGRAAAAFGIQEAKSASNLAALTAPTAV
jgi:hypothetical protein